MSKKVKATNNLAKDVKPKSVNVSNLSLTELKAAAYDILAQIEKNQTDLRLVNNQIIAKSK